MPASGNSAAVEALGCRGKAAVSFFLWLRPGRLEFESTADCRRCGMDEAARGRERALEELHALEMRVAGMLRDAADLLDGAQTGAGSERKAILGASRAYVERVLQLQRDMHAFVVQMPRGDYPRLDRTLLVRYTAALAGSDTQ